MSSWLVLDEMKYSGFSQHPTIDFSMIFISIVNRTSVITLYTRHGVKEASHIEKRSKDIYF